MVSGRLNVAKTLWGRLKFAGLWPCGSDPDRAQGRVREGGEGERERQHAERGDPAEADREATDEELPPPRAVCGKWDSNPVSPTETRPT